MKLSDLVSGRAYCLRTPDHANERVIVVGVDSWKRLPGSRTFVCGGGRRRAAVARLRSSGVWMPDVVNVSDLRCTWREHLRRQKRKAMRHEERVFAMSEQRQRFLALAERFVELGIVAETEIGNTDDSKLGRLHTFGKTQWVGLSIDTAEQLVSRLEAPGKPPSISEGTRGGDTP